MHLIRISEKPCLPLVCLLRDRRQTRRDSEARSIEEEIIGLIEVVALTPLFFSFGVMCYIFKLFYLCASSTKSNKRTEESQKSNLDGNSQGVVAASKEASRKQQQQLDETAQNASVATKIPIKSELSEFINASAGGNESQFGLKKLEFNETEIYEIEAANKALLDKPAKSSKSKSSGRDKKSSSSSHQKSATTAAAAANHQASSSSASCSSSPALF